MDFDQAGLLDGLEGDDRAARERLLERLAGVGYTLEELKSAVNEDRLPLLLVERVLGGRYTAKELETTGFPAAQMLRIRRLWACPSPRPQDRVYGEEEIDAAKSISLFLESGLGEDSIAEIARVLGEGMARLAATTSAAFVEAFLEPGDGEDEVAERFAMLAEQLVPAIDPVLRAGYRQHLAESVRRGMLSAAERESGEAGGAQEITVCFVDMVGFTHLGAEIEPHELGGLASRLAELAMDVTQPPVRLVKTIGDAAMFVSPDPAALVSVALSLLEAVQAADLPSLRAGVASGAALQRAGDYYGHAVNLASRVTGVARPGSVLCTEEVHDAAPDQFDWSFARKQKLKGMSDRSRCTARGGSAATMRPRRTTRPGAAGRAPRTSLRRNRKQIDDEHERRVRRNRRGTARLAVGEARRDDQLAAAADLHAGNSLHPSGDHAAVRERRRERLVAAPGGVELLAGLVQDAHVVDRDRVAGLGGLTRADDEVLGDQMRRRRRGRHGHHRLLGDRRRRLRRGRDRGLRQPRGRRQLDPGGLGAAAAPRQAHGGQRERRNHKCSFRHRRVRLASLSEEAANNSGEPCSRCPRLKPVPSRARSDRRSRPERCRRCQRASTSASG